MCTLVLRGDITVSAVVDVTPPQQPLYTLRENKNQKDSA
jgi:hypothetical protein